MTAFFAATGWLSSVLLVWLSVIVIGRGGSGVLVLTPDAADRTESSFSLGSHQAHPWLIYSAVRFWAEHPEHRDELSTTFAHQRIRSWRDAIAPHAAGGGGRP